MKKILITSILLLTITVANAGKPKMFVLTYGDLTDSQCIDVANRFELAVATHGPDQDYINAIRTGFLFVNYWMSIQDGPTGDGIQYDYIRYRVDSAGMARDAMFLHYNDSTEVSRGSYNYYCMGLSNSRCTTLADTQSCRVPMYLVEVTYWYGDTAETSPTGHCPGGDSANCDSVKLWPTRFVRNITDANIRQFTKSYVCSAMSALVEDADSSYWDGPYWDNSGTKAGNLWATSVYGSHIDEFTGHPTQDSFFNITKNWWYDGLMKFYLDIQDTFATDGWLPNGDGTGIHMPNYGGYNQWDDAISDSGSNGVGNYVFMEFSPSFYSRELWNQYAYEEDSACYYNDGQYLLFQPIDYPEGSSNVYRQAIYWDNISGIDKTFYFADSCDGSCDSTTYDTTYCWETMYRGWARYLVLTYDVDSSLFAYSVHNNMPASAGWDTLVWRPFCSLNVGGVIDAKYSTVQSGNDPRGYAYNIIKREYDSCYVYYRSPQGMKQLFDESPKVSYTLPFSMSPVNKDGTFDAPVSSIELQNAEGIVLWKNAEPVEYKAQIMKNIIGKNIILR